MKNTLNQNIFKETLGNVGENVVIIHAGGASHLDMSPIVKKLSQNYRVTNIDLPGTGLSPWDSSINNIHDLADHVVKELPHEAVYIGWSFGGLVAQSIASRYPARIKHLIGIGTTPRFIETDNWPGFPAPGFSQIVESLFKEGLESKDFLKLFYEEDFKTIDSKPDSYTEAQKLWTHPSTISNSILSKRMNMADNTDLRDLFKQISCPIDFIIGTQDNNVPKEAFTKIKALNPKVIIHEINGAGHAPFWTHQEIFNQILDNILGI